MLEFVWVLSSLENRNRESTAFISPNILLRDVIHCPGSYCHLVNFVCITFRSWNIRLRKGQNGGIHDADKKNITDAKTLLTKWLRCWKERLLENNLATHTPTKKLTPKQCENKDYENVKSKINDHETDGYWLTKVGADGYSWRIRQLDGNIT